MTRETLFNKMEKYTEADHQQYIKETKMTLEDAIAELKKDCENESDNKILAEAMAILEMRRAISLWDDDYEGWRKRYMENMYQLNDFQTKEEKYCWHDLRKNPKDLPKENEIVNVTWVNHGPVPYYSDIKDKPFSDASAIYSNGKWWWWSADAKDILIEYGESFENEIDDAIEMIAWKYIEPFEETEK